MILRKAYQYRVLYLLICIVLSPGLAHGQIADRDYLSKELAGMGGIGCISAVPAYRVNLKSRIHRSLEKLSFEERSAWIRKADLALKEPWELFYLNEFLEFERTGNRSEFEKKYFARREKLNRLLIGELISKDGKYLTEIINGLWLIMEESTWAVPAHVYLQKQNAKGVPNPDEMVVDLFAGETAAFVSWIKFLLADELNTVSPFIITRIDAELNRRIIKPYLLNNDFWWMGLQGQKVNNWNIWVNSNILLTTVLAVDDPGTRGSIIEKTIRSTDVFLNQYPEDGGCDEGASYWGLAGGKLIEYISLLSAISDGKLDWSDNGLIHNMGSYICKMHIDSNYFVNYADASARTIPSVSSIYAFGKLFNDTQLKQFASYLNSISASGEPDLRTGLFTKFINNIFFCSEVEKGTPHVPYLMKSWMPQLQVVALREKETKSGLFFSAKAGNNNESHNHNDIGNFILYMDGRPVIIDAGAGTYTKQTFSADRYSVWNMQSDWHNCPAVNGFQQRAGARYAAQSVSLKDEGKSTVLSMDIAKAYPEAAGINKWTRKFIFTASKRSLVLEEAYYLKQWKEPYKLNFLFCSSYRKIKDGLIEFSVLKGSPSKIRFTYDPGLFDITIEDKLPGDPKLTRVWGDKLSRLSLISKVRKVKGKHVVSFKVSE